MAGAGILPAMPDLTLVFDLDQTLVRGEALDWACYLDACDDALGLQVRRDDDWAAYPVLTDLGLLDGLSQRYRGQAATPAERDRADYLSRLQVVVAETPTVYSPVAGAVALLEALAGVARVGIATGNLRAAATLKLRASGLDRFALPVVCSEDAPDRPGLVRACLARLGSDATPHAVSIGDGEWDVDAAAALGLPFLGVAVDDARAARLRARGAREIVRDFTDLADVRARLGRLAGMGP